MIEFLQTIWGDLDGKYGEIRCLGGGPPEQTFYLSIEDAAADAVADAAVYDVYYGVLPRTTERGTSEACVKHTHVLWADVDAKRTGGKWAGLAGIRLAKQTPSIIVDSGHGHHCYWLLRDEVPFEQAQAAMKALAREVQGDSVWDAARILRIPGTTNRKDPDKPVPVRLVFWDTERKYRISDFDAMPEPEERIAIPGTGMVVSATPSWLTDLIRDGAPRGLRSETCFRAVVWMLRYGYTDDEIEGVFHESPDGIGEKYHELGAQGPRWLKRTIKAARSAA